MSEPQEFRPEMTSRRGEWIAWALALGLGAVLLFANQALPALSAFVWLFEGFLVFSAMSISLGNWMDRKTVIRVDDLGIAFENGLRSVRLAWSEVRNVAVMQMRGGRRAQVLGPASHFSFKLLSETNLFGQTFRTGFEAGQQILDLVVNASGLQNKTETEGMYYYSRT